MTRTRSTRPHRRGPLPELTGCGTGFAVQDHLPFSQGANMSTRFTPIFKKDGNDNIVPNAQLVYDTPEQATAGGANAGLVNGYGLVASGEVAMIDSEHGYEGPYVIASVGNITVWIVGGPTLDELTAQRSEAVVPVLITKKDIETEVPAFVLNGDHTGPD